MSKHVNTLKIMGINFSFLVKRFTNMDIVKAD